MKKRSKKRKGISTRSAKAKGRRLQNYVAEKISEITGLPWGKDEEIQGREMGQSGVDIKLSKRARKRFPFSVECKAQELKSIPIHDWMGQASKNIYPGTKPLLVVKRNFDTPLALIDLKTFMQLVKQAFKNQQQ